MGTVVFKGDAKRRTRSDQMLLSHDLVERLRRMRSARGANAALGASFPFSEEAFSSAGAVSYIPSKRSPLIWSQSLRRLRAAPRKVRRNADLKNSKTPDSVRNRGF